MFSPFGCLLTTFARRLSLAAAGIVLVGFAAGCEGAPAELLIDLRTDIAPNIEFDEVRTTIEVSSREVTHGVQLSADYPTGVRVAEFADLPPGDTRVLVELLLRGGVVLSRPLRVQVDGVVGITVVATRDCRGVSCADPAAQACLGGSCVAEECTPETPSACPSAPDCESDMECEAASACAAVSCNAGVCFEVPDAMSCAVDEVCSVESGCIDRPLVFAAPTSLADLAPGALRADDPALPADELELFFDVELPTGSGEIYVSTRSAISEPWPEAVPAPGLGGPGLTDTELLITGDGLELFFRRGSMLVTTTRPDRTSPWAAPVDLPSTTPPPLSDPTWLSPDGLRMFFGPRVLLVRDDRDSPWRRASVPSEVAVFAGLAQELVFYAGETRVILEISGVFHEASRPDTSSAFGPPLLLTGVDGMGLDTDAWVSEDGNSLYFSRGSSTSGLITHTAR